MKHLALLAAIYALIAALVLPSSLLASEDGDPAVADTPAAETAPAEEAPAAPAEPAPEQSAAPPEELAPAPPEPSAPEPQQPAPAPEQPAAAPAAPEEPSGKRKQRPAARAAANGSVTITDFQFTPSSISIDQGDTVTWTNNGPTPHSATAPDGSFDTGIFPAGQSRSHTFNDAGTFSYICTPHPNMQGTVVVRASQSSGDTPDSDTDDTGSGGTGGSGDTGSTGAEAAQSDGGPALPNTGTDAGALLILGALMLLLGVAVHRRARAAQPRPAGRIGW
jgi:LPXTG-motif cell wall-anchored protein